MIPCAPYIKSMCQSLRLPGSQENTPQGSPVKKESVVRVSDVKSTGGVVDVIESFNDNVSVYVPESEQAQVADVAKTLATFKPESPDVTRAAKRFEKARLRSEVEKIEVVCDIVEDVKREEEDKVVVDKVVVDKVVVDKTVEEKERDERRAEEEKRGARSKTTER